LSHSVYVHVNYEIHKLYSKIAESFTTERIVISLQQEREVSVTHDDDMLC